MGQIPTNGMLVLCHRALGYKQMITKRRIDADPSINPFPIIVTTDDNGAEYMRHASAPSLSTLDGSIRFDELLAVIGEAAKICIAYERSLMSKRAKRRLRGRANFQSAHEPPAA